MTNVDMPIGSGIGATGSGVEGIYNPGFSAPLMFKVDLEDCSLANVCPSILTLVPIIFFLSLSLFINRDLAQLLIYNTNTCYL